MSIAKADTRSFKDGLIEEGALLEAVYAQLGCVHEEWSEAKGGLQTIQVNELRCSGTCRSRGTTSPTHACWRYHPSVAMIAGKQRHASKGEHER